MKPLFAGRVARPCLAAIAALVVATPVAAQRPGDTTRTRADSAARLETITVTGIRAAEIAPISQKTIDRQTVERRYFGQDVPLVLQGAAPSLTAYAETGTFWGYSYMRLRGLDQSRINLTLDGIPLNDPEDQVLYFADFPDLGNSIHSVQVQRGVGTSTAGTASFAGSVNLETLPLVTTPRGGEAQLQVGSFESRRMSAEYATGFLPSRFAAYARLSGLRTDGYRHHAGVGGRSAFFSGGYFGDRNVFKVLATAGELRDTMAYLAVPESTLVRDRRSNPLTPEERDAFGEQLAALSYMRWLGDGASWSTTAYRISASGDYDVAIAPDLWNFNLDFTWYGVTSMVALTRADGRQSMTLGLNGNRYSRDHHAYIRPSATPLYFNTGHKRDANGFVKLSQRAGPALFFADLQLRRASFRYAPDAAAGIPGREISWHFFNPKAGVTYQMRKGLAAYGSVGRTTREPARSDMFAGFDNLDTTNADFVGPLSRVRPEQVTDAEAGVTATGGRYRAQVNVFSMHFRNEIAPIGALSYIGTPLRRNVGRSLRQGVELDVSWSATSDLRFSALGTIMRGRIAEYTDLSGTEPRTYRDVAPLLTPAVLTTHRVEWSARPGLVLSAEGRYQSRSNLRNTNEAELALPASYVIDASARLTLGRHLLTLHSANVGDSKRYSSGYAVDRVPHYYVLPPRSLFLTAIMRF